MSSKDAKKEPPEVTEFQKELHSLFESRTASKSKVDKLTKLALQSARYYKNIVYCIEKFITRCVPEYKLTGLYVLDSICRTSKSIKQKSSSSSFTGSEYVGRFERNIEALFAEFCKVQEDKEKEKVKRVVDLWERSGTFTPSVTENIKKKYFPLLETVGGAAVDSEEATTEGAEENATEKAASIISSLAASLGQTSDFARSPLASATPASSSSSNPATPTTTDGSAGTPTSSVFVSQAPQPVAATGAFGSPLSGNNNPSHSKPPDNALLAGFSDPSSAQALQTLLATISQVNAAAAASLPTTGSGQPNYQASSLMAPTSMPGFPGPSSHDLPPVLQQLQGVLANSNQNGAFLPNNNTMVSSTVASSSFLHSDPRAGSGSVSERSSAGPGPMIVHHQRDYSSNGLGGGGLLPTSLAPRDPRSGPVDPRLAFQQQQQAAGGIGHTQPPGSQPHAPPLPPSQQSQAPSQSQAQQALDPRTMAHLASFLNPASAMDGVMSLRLPPPGLPQVPMSMSMPMHMSMHGQPFPQLSSQGSQEGVGQGRGQGHGPGQNQGQGQSHGGQGQALRRDPHVLPSRPGSTQESFLARQGEFKGERSSRPADNTGFDPPEVKEDSTVGADKIRVISRTLWVGGTFIPTISEQDLEAIFAPKGQIATLIINQAKFNAFIKMADRTHAERCKVELDRTMVQGEVMKVGWGCGFGPRDCFDYTSGESIIPVDRLTDTDRRWLGQSIVGGFGIHEPIRGGVCIYEPNIEPVGPDGREALPRRGGGGGGGGPGGMTAARGGRGGGGVGGFAGRGRGRGFGQMDQQDGGGGASRGRGGMMMMNMGRGRGAGADEQHEQRTHPLPHRPPTATAAAAVGTGAGAGAAGARGWTGKRDFPQGPGQDMSVLMGNSGGSFPQVSHPSHSQDEEGGPRRNKKSRWE
ncbi:hypothetical protein BGZ72_008496 [Mortierella alpina]|nr:hypothetical protein BGZ72_008496 [Mortierella alpina]